MQELVLYGVPKFTSQRRTVDIPTPGPDEVLIKVRRGEDRALNAGDGMSGTVERVGSNVFEFKQGDRVAAFHRMGEPFGTYAEYPIAQHQPHLGLYQGLGLPLPTVAGQKDTPVLIYGGATAVGAFALQLAKLSKLSPIITVAGSGIGFVESLGATTHIIDYRKGGVARAILAALGGKQMHHALDAVSGKKIYEVVSEVLAASGGGKINMLDPAEDEGWKFPENVELSLTFVASSYSQKHPGITEEQAEADGEFAYFFYRYLSYLLAYGKFKPHQHKVIPNGLEGITEGV
ncbi:hypothetical protein B0T26DRAFT_754429 [Lasiosphaeria miniovina]|uniref:Enoyl reductase (ER) domain-containing protein n=1 Tax=Lasiosphaeria miniovina TaxID=1954250 RepID=A0AA40A4I4_9PEZI|nr:uncharacterized protein B0T26DRAFT_754429 [Lasiosphaeria miniovina]KAK0709178.1 hypothetical protein B0T26DRAFT_754429 [Lasiosphaeria miniovina]